MLINNDELKNNQFTKTLKIKIKKSKLHLTKSNDFRFNFESIFNSKINQKNKFNSGDTISTRLNSHISPRTNLKTSSVTTLTSLKANSTKPHRREELKSRQIKLKVNEDHYIYNFFDSEQSLEEKDEVIPYSIDKANLRKKIKQALKNKGKLIKFYDKRENTVNFIMDHYNVPNIRNNLISKKFELEIKKKKFIDFSLNHIINTSDNIYLSSLKKKYQHKKDEIFSMKVKPQTVKEMKDVIDEKYAIRYDVINERFDDLKNHRTFIDYFKYKYEKYDKKYFADEKVKNVIINEDKRIKNEERLQRKNISILKKAVFK